MRLGLPKFLIFSVVWMLVCPAVVAGAEGTENPTSADLEFFEKKVRPLLAEHCYGCHSVNSKKLQAGLLVDHRDRLLQGGDSGAAIVPHDPDASLLIQAVEYESYEMPPAGKLPNDDIETLRQWIEIGAPWPEEDAPVATNSASAAPAPFDLQIRQTEHWAWQPIQNPDAPPVSNSNWPTSDIDRFILAGREAQQLVQSGDVERPALLRRLYFDLIGLPPTPEQSARFLKDDAPNATERLVDELLASPHFGEHWARHWLDLVRYAESRGHEFDNDSPNAFQYRDYVIRAFNADVPYDQWVREHIAGDLLTSPRLHPTEGFNESILGTGFWYLGQWVHSPVDVRADEADRFDNMIDVMSKTFLGVTVACARCHDHKFDAISAADYYSLSGFLQSSDYRQVRFEALENNRGIAKDLAAVEEKYQQQVFQSLKRCGIEMPTPEALPNELARDVVFDYQNLPTEEFISDGFIFGERPRRYAEPYLSINELDSNEIQKESNDGRPQIEFASHGAAVNDLFWNGLESVSETGIHDQSLLKSLPSAGRTLRTPTFTLEHGNVQVRVKGQGHVFACVDSHRMLAGPLHTETLKPIEPDSKWVELNLTRYIGHRMQLEFVPAADKQLEVLMVVQGSNSTILDQLNERESRLRATIDEFIQAAQRCLAEKVPRLASNWADERKQLQSQIQLKSRLAIAIQENTGEDDHILIRGSAATPGLSEPRHFLTAISGNQPMDIPAGSGRLELAQQIVADKNPLTSRVIVNRIWHYLMGRGIVPTTDDFGVLGERPTHPDLLDHLATRFANDGHSIKKMIRYIVLSRTYQMSSHPDPAAMEADPKNRLWHHHPARRLSGEEIRDSLLALSGRMENKLFGEPVPVHLSSFMEGRGRPATSGPLDGAGRRSIYTGIRRNFLSPFMLAFDTPAPASTRGRRNVSNVPAQALILMNDPLVVELTQDWATRVCTQYDRIDCRIDWMYQNAFARPPTEREKTIAKDFLLSQSSEQNIEPDNLTVWANFAHALVNTKEFIFIR